jgi:hypothetical protein
MSKLVESPSMVRTRIFLLNQRKICFKSIQISSPLCPTTYVCVGRSAPATGGGLWHGARDKVHSDGKEQGSLADSSNCSSNHLDIIQPYLLITITRWRPPMKDG